MSKYRSMAAKTPTESGAKSAPSHGPATPRPTTASTMLAAMSKSWTPVWATSGEDRIQITSAAYRAPTATTPASSCITEAGIPDCAKRKAIAAVMASAAMALIAASQRDRSTGGRLGSAEVERRWRKSGSGMPRARAAALRTGAGRFGPAEFIASTITVGI